MPTSILECVPVTVVVNTVVANTVTVRAVAIKTLAIIVTITAVLTAAMIAVNRATWAVKNVRKSFREYLQKGVALANNKPCQRIALLGYNCTIMTTKNVAVKEA